MDVIGQFINGKVSVNEQSKRIAVINPANEDKLRELAFASSEEIELAIKAANNAYPAWSATPAAKRAQIFFKFKTLLDKNLSVLAKIVSEEHGKTLEDAKGSVQRGTEVVELYCNIQSLLQGDFSSNVGTDIDCQTIRQPLGVCAGVSPFNFPVMVPLWMMMPAIACGNCFILKPSEQVPSAPLKLLELLQEAGLPDGVVNLVQGDKEAVNHLLHHPEIQTMTAVASTPVAQYIYQTAIQQGKRSHTFGGAKNHCLVAKDANIEQAATAISGAAFGAAGERCMALSVAVVIGDDTADKLVSALKEKAKQLNIGPFDSPNADMGPLISKAHLEKVESYIELGVNEGANLILDGRKQRFSPGYYLGPSLFDNVKPSMRIYQDEIFGPVFCIIRANSFEEALSIINQHRYGNGSAIFTHDGYLARSFAEKVQAGMVGINIPIPVPVATHPFGGWKQSVFGDTNMHGKQSIHFYTKLKTITTRWPKEDYAHANAYVMPTH